VFTGRCSDRQVGFPGFTNKLEALPPARPFDLFIPQVGHAASNHAEKMLDRLWSKFFTPLFESSSSWGNVTGFQTRIGKTVFLVRITDSQSRKESRALRIAFPHAHALRTVMPILPLFSGISAASVEAARVRPRQQVEFAEGASVSSVSTATGATTRGSRRAIFAVGHALTRLRLWSDAGQWRVIVLDRISAAEDADG